MGSVTVTNVRCGAATYIASTPCSCVYEQLRPVPKRAVIKTFSVLHSWGSSLAGKNWEFGTRRVHRIFPRGGQNSKLKFLACTILFAPPEKFCQPSGGGEIKYWSSRTSLPPHQQVQRRLTTTLRRPGGRETPDGRHPLKSPQGGSGRRGSGNLKNKDARA